jgi:hypothetical protein
MMAGTMKTLRRTGKGRFYLALGYLIWSLLPHFHIVNHSHAGGSHVHASFATEEVNLANRVVDNLDPAVTASSKPAEFGGEALPRASLAGSRPDGFPGASAIGVHALVPGNGDAGRHGHYWEDPNLAGIVSGFSKVHSAAAFAHVAGDAYLAPSLRSLRSAPARGPPAFLTV